MDWNRTNSSYLAFRLRITPQKVRFIMGIFDKKSTTATAESPSTPPQIVNAPSTGAVSLKKGQGVTLDKSNAPIVASNGWSAKNKDYDLKALVRYRNGDTVYVGAANADELMVTPEGAVRHSGDARKAGELERITITWDSAIASVALSSYSALENGPGSFKKYGVFVELKNGSQTIGISAEDASADKHSYTCCFGEVIFEPDGRFTVVNHEMYSRPNSERRVGYHGAKVVMDAGPEGRSK